MVELGTGLLDGVIRVSLPKKLTFELRFKWLDWPSAQLGTVSGRGNGKRQNPSNPSSRGKPEGLKGWKESRWVLNRVSRGVDGRGEVGLGGPGQVRGWQAMPWGTILLATYFRWTENLFLQMPTCNLYDDGDTDCFVLLFSSFIAHFLKFIF